MPHSIRANHSIEVLDRPAGILMAGLGVISLLVGFLVSIPEAARYLRIKSK